MPIEFRCTSCQALLRLPDNAASTQAKCPQCGTIVAVPSASMYDGPGPGAPGARAAENPFQAPSASGYSGDPFARGNFELATRGQRFAGALIDWAAVAVPVAVMSAGSAIIDAGGSEALGTVLALVGFLATFGIAIVQWVLISTRGQSLGKIALGTRIIVGDNPGPPGFLAGVVLRAWVPGLIYAMPCVDIIFFFADSLWIFGEERRCLHDLIANTRVITA